MVSVKDRRRRTVERELFETAVEAGKEVAGTGDQMLAVLRWKGKKQLGQMEWDGLIMMDLGYQGL